MWKASGLLFALLASGTTFAQAKFPGLGSSATYTCLGGPAPLRQTQFWSGDGVVMTTLDKWSETEVSQDFRLWQYLAQIPGEYLAGGEFLRLTKVPESLERLLTLKVGSYQGEVEILGLAARNVYAVEVDVGARRSATTALGSKEVIPVESRIRSEGKLIAAAKSLYSPLHDLNLLEERNGIFGSYKCEIQQLLAGSGTKFPPLSLHLPTKNKKLTYRCRGDMRVADITVVENLGSSVILKENFDGIDQPRKTTNEQIAYAGLALQAQAPGEAPVMATILGEAFFQAPQPLDRKVFRGSIKTEADAKEYLRTELQPSRQMGTVIWGKIEVTPIVSFAVSAGRLIRRSYSYSNTHQAPVFWDFHDLTNKKKWDCELDHITELAPPREQPNPKYISK